MQSFLGKNVSGELEPGSGTDDDLTGYYNPDGIPISLAKYWGINKKSLGPFEPLQTPGGNQLTVADLPQRTFNRQSRRKDPEEVPLHAIFWDPKLYGPELEVAGEFCMPVSEVHARAPASMVTFLTGGTLPTYSERMNAVMQGTA